MVIQSLFSRRWELVLLVRRRDEPVLLVRDELGEVRGPQDGADERLRNWFLVLRLTQELLAVRVLRVVRSIL